MKLHRSAYVKSLIIAGSLLLLWAGCTQREDRATDNHRSESPTSVDRIGASAPTPAARQTEPQAPQTGSTVSGRIEPTATGTALSEKEKIEALIQVVEKAGCTVIRNGVEYPSDQAAEHLRSKWRHAGDRIKTARAFIGNIASKSSMTGRSYQIKQRDGTTVAAAQWLNQELVKIEGR